MTTQMEALQQIQLHRDEIDRIDEELISLLNKRAEQSLAIRVLKPAANMNLFDPGREQAIMDRLVEMSEGPLGREEIEAIYATLLKVMKEVKA